MSITSTTSSSMGTFSRAWGITLGNWCAAKCAMSTVTNGVLSGSTFTIPCSGFFDLVATAVTSKFLLVPRLQLGEDLVRQEPGNEIVNYRLQPQDGGDAVGFF